MIVRYCPLPESCKLPSELEPYSPEMTEFAPELTVGSSIAPAAAALLVPFNENWYSVSGAAWPST